MFVSYEAVEDELLVSEDTILSVQPVNWIALCHDPERVVSHLVNMLHGGFISIVVVGEESRIFKGWSLVGSSCIIEGAAMEGIEVIISGLRLSLGAHCYRRTSLALFKLTLTF